MISKNQLNNDRAQKELLIDPDWGFVRQYFPYLLIIEAHIRDKNKNKIKEFNVALHYNCKKIESICPDQRYLHDFLLIFLIIWNIEHRKDEINRKNDLIKKEQASKARKAKNQTKHDYSIELASKARKVKELASALGIPNIIDKDKYQVIDEMAKKESKSRISPYLDRHYKNILGLRDYLKERKIFTTYKKAYPWIGEFFDKIGYPIEYLQGPKTGAKVEHHKMEAHLKPKLHKLHIDLPKSKLVVEVKISIQGIH